MNNELFEALDEVKLLTLCIYGEARNQGLDGMLAVGSVVMNRAREPKWWGTDARSVILKDWQFSCFNECDANRPLLEDIAKDFDTNFKIHKALRWSWWIATGIMEGHLSSNVSRATHYYSPLGNDANKPDWADKLTWVVNVKDHRFYV